MFVLASSEKNGAQLLITTARTGARPRSGDRATRTPRRGAHARTARGTASRGCVQREAGRGGEREVQARRGAAPERGDVRPRVRAA
jgi:hypothetical protein